jgi:hypothetical protein
MVADLNVEPSCCRDRDKKHLVAEGGIEVAPEGEVMVLDAQIGEEPPGLLPVTTVDDAGIHVSCAFAIM